MDSSGRRPYKLGKEYLEKMDVIKVICNQSELHELMDLFEDGRIPQPLFTQENDCELCGKKYIIFIENKIYDGESVLEILERTLGRK